MLSEAFGAIEGTLGQLRKPTEGQPIALSCSPSFAMRWLTPRLGGFMRDHPGVGLRVFGEFHALDLRRMVRHGAEAAVRFDPGGYTDLLAVTFRPHINRAGLAIRRRGWCRAGSAGLSDRDILLVAFIVQCDICYMTTWLILTATLPTTPSALRVRVWRALKATGAGTLREGVYVLPEQAATAQALWDLQKTISEAGAEAHMLVVQARDEAQERTFKGLFDRSEMYAELLQSIKEVRPDIKKATEAQLHKLLRDLERQVQTIQRTDFFPGKDGERAAAALAALRREVELRLSPDEPAPSEAAIELLAFADYQGRTWSTRKRPWVDRLATAWLVQRFIDMKPSFAWLADPKKCSRTALGYDFDGATFTHVGDKVTFEVVAQSFGLLEDRALQRLAGLVHYIDVGGIPVDEAPGFEMLIRGLQAKHPDDDALLAAAIPVFDAYYAALQIQ